MCYVVVQALCRRFFIRVFFCMCVWVFWSELVGIYVSRSHGPPTRALCATVDKKMSSQREIYLGSSTLSYALVFVCANVLWSGVSNAIATDDVAVGWAFVKSDIVQQFSAHVHCSPVSFLQDSDRMRCEKFCDLRSALNYWQFVYLGFKTCSLLQAIDHNLLYPLWIIYAQIARTRTAQHACIYYCLASEVCVELVWSVRKLLVRTARPLDVWFVWHSLVSDKVG